MKKELSARLFLSYTIMYQIFLASITTFKILGRFDITVIIQINWDIFFEYFLKSLNF